MGHGLHVPQTERFLLGWRRGGVFGRGSHPAQRFRVHQIFYNEESYAALDPGFIPLDNSRDSRPDWYEFWAILQFLRSNALEANVWYGFLSPRFKEKVGLGSASVFQILDSIHHSHDVALLPVAVDQIVYFKNVFEQGEFCHPSLIGLSKKFIARAGIDIDLDTLVSHSGNACFSNFIVAKAPYWDAWRRLAEAFFSFAEDPDSETGMELRKPTSYLRGPTPMKVFIQERLSALVLAAGQFCVFSLPLTFSLKRYPSESIETLTKIDDLKRRMSAAASPELTRALDGLRQRLKFDGDLGMVLPAGHRG
ncbi:MAG: hypothetical protein K2Z80_19830 [Xanthobacteraceae bacterium]|nr:hypothetical protein [Xanthobacteraceae bacterium]